MAGTCWPRWRGPVNALSLLCAGDRGVPLRRGQRILGVYNLLPIRGLDGGRALYLAVAWARALYRPAGVLSGELITLALLLALVVGLVWETGGGCCSSWRCGDGPGPGALR